MFIKYNNNMYNSNNIAIIRKSDKHDAIYLRFNASGEGSGSGTGAGLHFESELSKEHAFELLKRAFESDKHFLDLDKELSHRDE